jgi:predicted dienelactone hydrolase
MRFLEILLVGIVTILPIYISFRDYQKHRLIILSILAILLISHLVFEGYRWQLLLVYVLTIVLLFCVFKNYKFFKGGMFRKTISYVVFILILIPSWALPNIFPIFKLPQPTGAYNVGSQYFHLKTNRDEIITKDSNDKRELMVKIWYPTEGNEKKEIYLDDGDKKGFSIKYGLPETTFNYLNQVQTHTYENAAIVDGKFPVLIFSHGYFSQANGYYSLLEEIVSRGYIVLALNHTYESTGSAFPKKNIKFYSNEFNRILNDEKMASMAWEIQEGYSNAKDWNAQHEAVKDGLKNYAAANISKRWTEDVISLLDELENWNKTTFLKNRIDFSKIGAFGHSQGGTTAGESLLRDSRIKAAVNIDGVQWGTMIDTMMQKPFMLLESTSWPKEHPRLNQHAFHNGSTTDFYDAKILNSGHSNFMDIPLMINLRMINEAGTIHPNKASKITTDLVVDFFDKYLNNKSKDILSLQEKHEELEISMHKKRNSKK